MKTAILCGVVIVAVLASIPASAQVLVLYDNFQSKVLSPDKWFGEERSDPGVPILESGRVTVKDPITGNRFLEILNRSYASEGSDSGNSTASTRLVFADGNLVTTIQARVYVNKIQATGCSSINTFATKARARIGGAFFNAGATTPIDQTNDVFAFIGVGRAIDSTNPPNVLNIKGGVVICNDGTCSNPTPIGSEVDLGTIRVQTIITLRITWDQVNNLFAFQRGTKTPVTISYSQSDSQPPFTGNGGGNKRLEVEHEIANCTSAPRPVAGMDAFFDNIMVN